jgi:hypothetical protein
LHLLHGLVLTARGALERGARGVRARAGIGGRRSRLRP